MAFTIIEEHEALPQRCPVIVIYGEAGSGKTSLAFTVDDPLLLDFDEGVNRCVGRKKNVRFERWEDVLELLKPGGYLETHRPATLITDTGGEMLDGVMTDFALRQSPRNAHPGGGLSQQGFGVVKDLFNVFIRRCKALEILPIFVCHVVEKGNGDERRLRPKMTGGSYDILLAKADLVGYLEMRGNKRTLSFNPTTRCVGKNCVEFDVIEIPHYGSPEWGTFFQGIINKTRQRMAATTEAQRQALEQVKEAQDAVSGCTSFKALAKSLTMIEGLPLVYQSQVLPGYQQQFRQLFAQRYTAAADTLAQFNDLLPRLLELPKMLEDVKRDVVKAAREKGYAYVREQGGFVPAPAPSLLEQAAAAKVTDPALADSPGAVRKLAPAQPPGASRNQKGPQAAAA